MKDSPLQTLKPWSGNTPLAGEHEFTAQKYWELLGSSVVRVCSKHNMIS